MTTAEPSGRVGPLYLRDHLTSAICITAPASDRHHGHISGRTVKDRLGRRCPRSTATCQRTSAYTSQTSHLTGFAWTEVGTNPLGVASGPLLKQFAFQPHPEKEVLFLPFNSLNNIFSLQKKLKEEQKGTADVTGSFCDHTGKNGSSLTPSFLGVFDT